MSRMRLSRRSLLGSVGAASIAPALADAGREQREWAPELPQTVAAFQGRLLTGPQQRVNQSPARYAAAILGGEFTGPLLSGAVQSGRIEWSVDAESQALHISAQYTVLQHDGVLVEVRDRGVHPRALQPARISRLQTSPEISSSAECQESAPLLVGLLDASGFSSGQVMLRAFRVV